ncbi:hypothetical protein SEA_DESIREEROSE_1 [Microbacterium phage DesireeRose]|nr:hypothetical protein SEA_DESIREEROSE_1 [Microbacterium phage DesireeRose]
MNQLPGTPHIGLDFRPDTTDSIGTVTNVETKPGKGRNAKPVHTVTYHYAHAPEKTYTRNYEEVRSMAWPIA